MPRRAIRRRIRIRRRIGKIRPGGKVMREKVAENRALPPGRGQGATMAAGGAPSEWHPAHCKGDYEDARDDGESESGVGFPDIGEGKKLFAKK